MYIHIHIHIRKHIQFRNGNHYLGTQRFVLEYTGMQTVTPESILDMVWS